MKKSKVIRQKLLSLRDRMLNADLSENGRKCDPNAVYPSDGWNSVSWTMAILDDAVSELKWHRQILRILPFNLQKIWLRLFKKNSRSSHDDFEHKVLLWQLLNKIAPALDNKTVVLPECGPAGLDIFIARSFAFNRILAFDANEGFVDSAKKIHAGDPRVTVSKQASEELDINSLLGEERGIIVIPDWPHGKIEKFKPLNEQNLVIRYSFRDRNHSVFFAARQLSESKINPLRMLKKTFLNL
jgi:hypothetical protein